MTLICVSVNAQTEKGDLNGDGSVGNDDVTCLINKILGPAVGTNDFDINEDGKIDIADVTSLINIIASEHQESSYVFCPDDHHPHMIDLGLPSGTKWACCNVEALKPENFGSYYAWGETEAKDNYSWETYIHCDGTQETCHFLGDICGTEYDVAHIKWGGQWHMPNRYQMDELFENCSYEWITLNGTKGGKFTSKTNGNSIFFPAAGFFDNSSLFSVLSSGCYWNGTPNPVLDYCIFSFPFYDNSFYGTYNWRYRGNPVRPVISETIASPLLLSSSTLNVIVGNERAVEITSGSCFYTVKSSNENVATAVSQSFYVNVTAIGVGNATITVTDTRTNQTATIDVTVIPSLTNCPDDHHPHMIDLGLPSGIKWSCCNVGSTSPEGLGGYYAWAETEEKDNYSWSTYLYCDGTQETCQFLGNITGTTYDVAHVKWGSAWRMPTGHEADELRSNCNVETITYSNLVFDKFTGPNGNSIFIPYAGSMWYASNNEIGEQLWCWTSDQHSNRSSAQYLRQTGIMGFCWLFEGLPVRPVYDPSFFISLSEETVDMFVNSTTGVRIEMGSGEYELQYDQTDIIDAELIMANTEEDSDAKDEISIYGVAEGTATLHVLDKTNNKTATLVVNVKTPTEEDIANTKDYITNVGSFINIQGEFTVDAFQSNLLSWLGDQNYVRQVNLSSDKSVITITFVNGVNFLITFQDVSFFNDYEEIQNSRLFIPRKAETDNINYYDVSYQNGETIINNLNILYIQGRTMLSEDLAAQEFNCMNYLKYHTFVGITKPTIKKKTLSFLKDLKEQTSQYGMIIISQTHGYIPQTNKDKNKMGAFQIEDIEAWNNWEDPNYLETRGYNIYIKNKRIEKIDEEGIFWIMPRLGKEITKKASIVYGGYCCSSGIKQSGSFFGYDTPATDKKNTEYLIKFTNNIVNGMTFENATNDLVDYLRPTDNGTEPVKVNKTKTKHRYFSIVTDDVTKFSQRGYPIVTGRINGYENISGISSYSCTIHVFDKNETLNPQNIQFTGNGFRIKDDGTFEFEYTDLPLTECTEEYNFVMAFKLGNNIYYGGTKKMAIKGICPNQNHPHMIDLGLPSGTKWSCCNVGANKPWEYGEYFAWGEISDKATYSLENYKYAYQDENGRWFFNTDETAPDISGTDLDVAYKRNKGKMPSHEKCNELIESSSSYLWRWTSLNGIKGLLVIGENDSRLFFPAAGKKKGSESTYVGEGISLWTSTLRDSSGMSFQQAGLFHDYYKSMGTRSTDYVYFGHPIRPISR